MKTFLLGMIAILTAMGTNSATAQSRNCGERTEIIQRLQDGYGESRAGAGLSTTNGIVEVFASEESGTWTIILTLPTGKSCLVAAGNSWESGPTKITKSGLPV
ncbi:MAG: hypothetical protein AAGB10_05390 [Pseudomonadota bacterium]